MQEKQALFTERVRSEQGIIPFVDIPYCRAIIYLSSVTSCNLAWRSKSKALHNHRLPNV